LSTEEVTRYALPHLPSIAQCYRKHAMPARKATGDLYLAIQIDRTGQVVDLDVTAPGVLPRRLGRLTRCLRNEVAHWRFPKRTGYTRAVVPYFFLHTKAPASGPRQI
jgi:hypothetical protein